MGHLNERLFQKQARYIRLLEEQLAVYEEKDRAQELLIRQLDRSLGLLAQELGRYRAGTEQREPGEG